VLKRSSFQPLASEAIKPNMSNKKRKTSPSESHRSSATPAPSFPVANAPLNSVSAVSSPSSRNDQDSLSVAGPSRSYAVPIKEESQIAKGGSIVVGSGDGLGYGDECFTYTDLPMNKQGE
jgi:hypothetical protein